MATTCPTCSGSYETNQRGGVYLHACAPVLSSVKVLRAGTVQTVTPDKLVGTDAVIDMVYTERVNKVDQTTIAAQTKGG